MVARLDDIDPMRDGQYRYRPVRHHLGITSFGVTAWVGAAAGDPIINEYDEDSEPTEELFVVVSGRAIFEFEGKKVEATPGTLLAVEPGARRTAVAAESATTVLAFDGTLGKAYDATGWELWAPLRRLYDEGEHSELQAQLKHLIAGHPQYPMLVYTLACSESLSGHIAQAIVHLRQAVSASEKFRDDARDDSDVDPIRQDPSFRALIGK
jgi:hypothetical protein